MKKGLFITFEGPDGSGKSTIIELLKEYYKDKDIVFTREPGGTEISEKIRELVLSKENKEMSAQTESLLYAASRAQHVNEFILPKLQEGKTVISDRYVLSSLAYQGGARGLGVEKVKEINDFATSGLKSDLILFFNVDPLTVLKRKGKVVEADRVELSGDLFHKKVYETYISLLEKFKNDKNFIVIDATKNVEDVFKQVVLAIDERLGEN